MGFGTVCGTYPSPQGRVGNPRGLALPIMGDEYCGQLTQDGGVGMVSSSRKGMCGGELEWE